MLYSLSVRDIFCTFIVQLKETDYDPGRDAFTDELDAAAPAVGERVSGRDHH